MTIPLFGDAEDVAGQDLENRARALHLALDYPGSIRAYERAYAAYRREGDLLSAARAARTLGWFHGSVFGDWAVFRGWSSRALTLLEQAGEDSPEHGWVLVAKAQAGNDFDEQQRLYLRAVETARRCGDADLECEALASLGIMVAFSGHVAEGMAHLDEALATICVGEVADLSVVEGVFCGLFHACERTHDVGRAAQWLRAADEYVRRQHLVAVGGYCRAYYGGILTAAGRWSEAENVLTTALTVFPPEYPHLRANVLCRLANLRLQQGRLEEAAELLDGLGQHEDAVRPLAALYLARGEHELARDLLERTLDAGGFEDVGEAALLALLVDVELASGAVDRARGLVERLTDIAQYQTAPYVLGVVAVMRGKVCVASGEGDPRSCFHDALTYFTKAQLPLDGARTQLELAKALAPEAPEAAVAHGKGALESFQRLAAGRDVDAACAVLRSLGAPPRLGMRGSAELTRREAQVFELVGLGLNNAEIAQRLFISPKTVEHHVGRILAKLGLPSRARAVAQALASSGGERSSGRK